MPTFPLKMGFPSGGALTISLTGMPCVQGLFAIENTQCKNTQWILNCGPQQRRTAQRADCCVDLNLRTAKRANFADHFFILTLLMKYQKYFGFGKYEAAFVNQLLVLFHKCGLRFSKRASEHYDRNRQSTIAGCGTDSDGVPLADP